jgi:signal transduction histidine kinase
MGPPRSGTWWSRVVRLVAPHPGSVRPRRTVRLRLTLVFGSFFLASGIALLAITYVLVKQDIGDNFVPATKEGIAAIIDHSPRSGVAIGFARVSQSMFPANGGNSRFVARQISRKSIADGGGIVPVHAGPANHVIHVPVPGVAPGKVVSEKQAGEQIKIITSDLLAEAQTQQGAELHQLLFDSGIALLIMAVLSVLLGWLVAGRALRPLRVITSKAQEISSTNLHERIALRGPDDEMKRLGDTFNDLLARLERAFDAQRQFVANASHELRTPLARQRTLLEVASEDPEADVVSLREASLKAIAAGEEQEKLIEALLTLASSGRGLDDRSPFDLEEVARAVVESKRQEATLRGLDVQTEVAGAPTTGNRRLAERLVANLIDNALRYNGPRGWVVVTTSVDDGHAVLRVANSGPVVPEGEIERLFEPFQRLESDRITREGHGLGLSIVRAVAAAHGATVTATSRPAGGLDLRVAFPLSPEGVGKGPVTASGRVGDVVTDRVPSPGSPK